MTEYERPKPLLDPRASYDELIRRLDRIELMVCVLVDDRNQARSIVGHEAGASRADAGADIVMKHTDIRG
jgi:hypothetical protein